MNAPMQSAPIEAFDILKLRDVRPARWQMTLAALGLDMALPKHQFTTSEAVEAYFLDQPDPRLLDALSVIHDLGSPAGRDAILQARRACALTPVHDADVEGPAEEALALWVASLSSKAEEDVLTIASVIASRKAQQNFFEYRGLKPVPMTAKTMPQAKLRAALEDYFKAHGMPGGVQLTCTDWQGDIIIRVLHGERQIIVHEKTTRGTRRLPLVPATNDLMRYNPGTGVIAIRSRVTLIDPYRNLIGYEVFGDAKFFQDDAVINLDPLRRKQVLEQAADVPGVLRVTVTRLEFQTPLGRTILYGKDCHRQSEHEGSSGTLATSRIKSAVLSIVFEGTSARQRCNVRLAPPNIRKISDRNREELVRSLLRRLGILLERGPEASAGDLITKGFSPLAAWEERYGSAATAACVQSGVLAPGTEDEASSLPPGADDSVLIPIPGLSIDAKGIAVIDDSARAPVLVPKEAKIVYGINASCVANVIANVVKVTGPPRHHAQLGAYEIGLRQYSSGHAFHGFFALREVSQAAVDSMRQIAHPHPLVLVTPQGASWPALTSCTSVEITLPALSPDDLPYRLMHALKYTDHVCPSEWSPPSHPLVLHRKRRTVVWKREIVPLKTPEDFDRLLLLAEAQGSVVNRASIAANAGSEAKRLINDLSKQLPADLADHVEVQRGVGWYLTTKALVL